MHGGLYLIINLFKQKVVSLKTMAVSILPPRWRRQQA